MIHCNLKKKKWWSKLSKMLSILSPLWHSWWWRNHDVMMKWNHIPYYWPFVRRIHQSSMDFLHKGPVMQALMSCLMLAQTNSWMNSRVASDLRCHDAHCDITVMFCISLRIWYNRVCVIRLSWSSVELTLFRISKPNKIEWIWFTQSVEH